MPSPEPSATTPRRRRHFPLLREVFANVASRPALALVAGLVMIGAPLTAYIAEANASVAFDTYQQRLVTTGYTTLYLTRTEPDSPATLTAGTCDELTHLPGVRATMWFQAATTLQLWNQAGPVLATRRAGGGVLDVLAITDPAGASQAAGAELLIDPSADAANHTPTRRAGLRVLTDTMATTVTSAAVDLNALGDGLEASSLTLTHAAADQRIDTCVALVTMTERSAVRETFTAAFPSSQNYLVRWALSSADQLDNPITRFHRRPSQHTWLAATIAAVLIWAMYLRIRRNERAFYSILGLTPTRLHRLVRTEQLAYFVPATAAALLVASAATRRHGIPDTLTDTAIRSFARATLATLLTCAAHTWYDARRTTTTALTVLKDR